MEITKIRTLCLSAMPSMFQTVQVYPALRSVRNVKTEHRIIGFGIEIGTDQLITGNANSRYPSAPPELGSRGRQIQKTKGED